MKQKGFTPIIILVIIALFGIVGYFVYKNGYLNSFITKPNLALNLPPSIIPITEDKKVLISTAVDSKFKDVVSSLTANLKDWDPNYVVTTMTLEFGRQFGDLTKMYETGVPKMGISVWVYSPKQQTSRMYELSENGLTQSGKDTDMSRYGPQYKRLTVQNYIPVSPKNAIEKCMEYATNKGNYLLSECANVADNYSTDRNWICTFVDAKQASKTTVLGELNMDRNNQNQLCDFNSETNSVSDWSWQGPPID